MPVRNPKQRMRDMAIVEDLYLQGVSMRGIVARLEQINGTRLAVRTIEKDIKALRAQWRKEYSREIDIMRCEEIRRLNRIESEAWAEWERSKKPSEEKNIEEQTGPTTGASRKTMKAGTKSRTGDPQYLAIALRCSQQRADLLGLSHPDEVEVTVQSDNLISMMEKAYLELPGAMPGNGMAKWAEPIETTATPGHDADAAAAD